MGFNRTMAVYTTTGRKARVYQAAPQSLQELFDRLKVSPTPSRRTRPCQRPSRMI